MPPGSISSSSVSLKCRCWTFWLMFRRQLSFLTDKTAFTDINGTWRVRSTLFLSHENQFDWLLIMCRPSFSTAQEHSSFFPSIWWFIPSIITVLTCVSLAASGDLEGLEILSLAGADLNKPGYNGQTAIQVVGFRARSCPFSPTFSPSH